MAVGGKCSGGRGVCEPLATLGGDGLCVNATMPAYGRLLVDDPERIGPVQAHGMDQTQFNRVGGKRTQQWAMTFDSPLKSEGPVNCTGATSIPAARDQSNPRWTNASSCVSGTAPTSRSTTAPSRISSRVGMLMASYLRATPGESSTFTLVTFKRPGFFAAIRSTAGETIRHGPHHGAHRSTSTGVVARSTTASKVESVASVSHGRGALHAAQAGLPDAEAGTRFFVPQDGHF